ncbi:MAG: ABC transporter permease [Syntrophobacteraceae bacterium]
MALLKLILRNGLRQGLRSSLTVTGMAVAILAFCLLRTTVEAWYAGVAAASPNRLVSRNSVSLIFTLPLSYRQRILSVPEVSQVAYANWFGGVYIDEKHFFPRMAVGPSIFFDLFPEFRIAESEVKAFWTQRNGCIAGRKLVDKYRWKPGDTITFTGNIYPGEWRFVLVGVYDGATKTTDETQFFFRWDYLDEVVKKMLPSESGRVGWYIVQVSNPNNAGTVSSAIDALFRSSLAETLTETEKAFQMSFVAMTEAIVVAVRVVSFVVIGVILIVLANTMAMTARERQPEYATLKTLGFGPGFIVTLIVGESMAIALLGGILGLGLSVPTAKAFSKEVGPLLPVFHVHWKTMALSLGVSLVIGIAAAVLPAWRAVRVRIVEALGHVG